MPTKDESLALLDAATTAFKDAVMTHGVNTDLTDADIDRILHFCSETFDMLRKAFVRTETARKFPNSKYAKDIPSARRVKVGV